MHNYEEGGGKSYSINKAKKKRIYRAFRLMCTLTKEKDPLKLCYTCIMHWHVSDLCNIQMISLIKTEELASRL